jgi:hypothetical protein
VWTPGLPSISNNIHNQLPSRTISRKGYVIYEEGRSRAYPVQNSIDWKKWMEAFCCVRNHLMQ